MSSISEVLPGISLAIPNLLGHKLGRKLSNNRTDGAFNAFNNPLELVLIALFNDNDIL
jgi:hypothetical protein